MPARGWYQPWRDVWQGTDWGSFSHLRDFHSHNRSGCENSRLCRLSVSLTVQVSHAHVRTSHCLKMTFPYRSEFGKMQTSAYMELEHAYTTSNTTADMSVEGFGFTSIYRIVYAHIICKSLANHAPQPSHVWK